MADKVTWWPGAVREAAPSWLPAARQCCCLFPTKTLHDLFIFSLFASHDHKYHTYVSATTVNDNLSPSSTTHRAPATPGDAIMSKLFHFYFFIFRVLKIPNCVIGLKLGTTVWRLPEVPTV